MVLGTHISDQGRGVVDCDVYDLTLSVDGFKCEGFSKGQGNWDGTGWNGTIKHAVSSALPTEEEAEQGVKFFDVGAAIM